MITIRLGFPAGRYHATPWGRHVNEGVTEWPPSPYRLLRALYDVWQRKCAQLTEDEVGPVLESLAASPPRFTLPLAFASHTRSYLSANEKDPTSKNLVFDSFLAFEGDEACFLTWSDLELTLDKRATLGLLLGNLNYLGRSESWVSAEIWDGEIAGLDCDVVQVADAGGELSAVACAVPRSEYAGKGTWLDALTASSASLLKERASSPPLLRSVRYVFPTGSVSTDVARKPVRKALAVQAVLLGLDATVLPLVTTTLEVADQIRVRLMGAHKRRTGAEHLSPLFSGKTAEGEPRKDHGHVYILPLGSGEPTREGRIDRVLIISPLRPFTPDELDAVRGVRELYQSDGRPAVRCVLTWQGGLEGEVARSWGKTFVSTTPFVPPRHWRKGRDFGLFLRDEIRRECLNHSVGGELESVEVLPAMPGRFHSVEYRRNRKGDPVRPGYAMRLTFRGPVLGPFAVGYGAHFGLGQFRRE